MYIEMLISSMVGLVSLNICTDSCLYLKYLYIIHSKLIVLLDITIVILNRKYIPVILSPL